MAGGRVLPACVLAQQRAVIGVLLRGSSQASLERVTWELGLSALTVSLPRHRYSLLYVSDMDHVGIQVRR